MEISLDTILEMAKESMFGTSLPGICTACGAEHLDGVDPDSEDQECEVCGARAVAGAEQLMFMHVP
jgi:hypothetical protein